MKIKFTKMQAYGNDYVYIFTEGYDIKDYNTLAKRISNRNYGVGSDGMVLISYSNCCDFRMRIFNPDGTEAEMCGNALRSTAKFVYYHGLTTKTTITIETYGGNQTLDLTVENGEVVNIHAVIGKPVLEAEKIPALTKDEMFLEQQHQVVDKILYLSAMSWGNPHTVVYVDDVLNFDVEKYGNAIEHLDCFPERTNVTFAQIVNENYIKMREWERGTGETLGCGTGCCASVVISNILGKCGRKVSVEQPGGILDVVWDEDGNVHMYGPSYVVYEGEYLYELE